MLNARVVHQNIDLAKTLGGKGHYGLNIAGLAHVGAVVGHVHAERTDLGLRAFGVAKTVEHNVGALARQRLGDAQTNTAGRSGHEGCLVLQHKGYSCCPLR